MQIKINIYLVKLKNLVPTNLTTFIMAKLTSIYAKIDQVLFLVMNHDSLIALSIAFRNGYTYPNKYWEKSHLSGNHKVTL